MPMLDMSLERLKNYQGINPKPADFDQFWDNELEKIHAYNGKYEFTDANYPVCGVIVEDLNFVAPDGSVIHGKIARPEAKGKYPTLFNFHGKSGNFGSVKGLLSWVAAGFAVAALDCRSQSGPSGDATDRGLLAQAGLVVRGLNKGRDYLYYKDVYLDVVRFVDIIKAQPYCDTDRLYAHGGSQGGALTVVCAALCPEIKAMAPVYPFLCDYKRLYEMDQMERAYSEIKEYVRCFCPCDDEERAKMWETLGYIDIQFLAPRIKADTLWFTGLMDNVCPPSTQFAAYNKITANKEMVIYTNHGHEGNWRTDDRAFQFIVNHPTNK